MLTKQLFESLIKKDISDKTFNLYNNLWLTYKQMLGKNATPESFIKVLNVREIEQDDDLRQRRLFAKKQIPKVEKTIKDLESKKADLNKTIDWLQEEGSQITDYYRYEKLQLNRKIKEAKLELLRLKNSIK